MGRYLNTFEIQDLSDVLQLKLSIFRTDKLPDISLLKETLSALSSDKQSVIHVIDKNTIAGYGLIRDLNANPAVVIETKMPRDIFAQGLHTNFIFLGMLIFVCVFFSIAIVFMLRRQIISRLELLSRDIGQITVNEDFSRVIPVFGKDELSDVSDNINKLLSGVVESRFALVESEKHLENIILSMADWVWEVDKNGFYTYSSHKVFDILGRFPEEIIGKKPFDFMPSDEAERITAIFSEIIEKKLPIKDLENWNIAKNGNRVCLLTNALPVLDENGNLKFYRGVDKDITERKLAERALQESESRYRKLFETSLTGNYVTKVDGTILDFNNAMMQMLGYGSREELFQHNSFDFYANPDFRKELIYLLQKDGIVPGKEAVLLRRDGSFLYAIGHAILQKDEITGEPFIHGSAIDISVRKNIEEALKESEERLRISSNAAGFGTYSFDFKLGTGYWSPEMKAFYGLSSDEPLLLNADMTPENLHPDDRKAFLAAMNEANNPYGSSEGIFNLEFRIIHVDGDIRWLRVNGRTEFKTEDNICQPWRAIGAVIDITSRKLSEEALRRSEESLREAQMLSKIGNWEWDVKKQTLIWSDEVFRIFGVTPKSFKPTVETFESNIHPDDREYFLRQREQMLNEKNEACIDHRIILPDGEVRFVQERTNLILGDNGEVIRVIGTVQDITMRKKAEEALIKSEERFSKMTRVLTDYIYTTTIKDSRAIATEYSPGCATITGYTDEEYKADPYLWYKMVYEEDRQAVLEHAEDILKKIERPLEHRIIHKNGSVRWIKNTPSLRYNDNGELIAYDSMVNDITDRKLAEEVLREVSLYSRSLLEASLDPLVTISPEGRITDVNTATEKITGISRESLIGSDFADYFTEPDMARAGYLKVFELGHVIDYPLTLRHISGAKTDVLYNASVYRNEQGEVLGVFAAARDITKSKRIEEALRESESNFRSLIENSLMGISTVDTSGRFIQINLAYAQMYGYVSPDEMMAEVENVEMLYANPEVRKDMLRILDEKGFIEPREVEVLRRDGTPFSVFVATRKIEDADGKLIKYQATQIDISARKQAEDALKESEERFRRLLQDVKSVAVQGYGPDGTTQYWNKSSELLYGYTEQEAIGRNLLDLIIPPEMREDVKKAISYMAETGHPIPASELSLMRKDGSLVDVYSNHAIVQIPGRKQELFCIDIDITALKRAEEALRESEERYRVFINSTDDMACLKDNNFRYLLVNRANAEFFRKEESEIIGKTDFDLMPEEAARMCRNSDQKVFISDEVVVEEESVGRRIYETHKFKVPLKGGEYGIGCYIKDISNRKKNEEKIKASLKEKEVLLREIHHRVKNNLQVISSLLNLQADKAKDTKYNEIISESINRINSMSLIHNLLYQSENLSKINFEKYVPQLCDSLLSIYNLPERKINVVYDIENIELKIDTAIPCGLIINELVSNSLKHAFPSVLKGYINISIMKRNSGTIQLSVHDNGIGLPEDMEIKKTNSLGLQLVSLLTKQLNGNLTIKSVNGTIVIITFKVE